MTKMEMSIVINRPVEEVFEFVTNPENEPLYRSGLLESEITSEGPYGVGTTTREVSQFLGRRIETTAIITEYEPNRKIALKTTSGPIPFNLSQTFEPVGGGTKVTTALEGEVGGFFKLAEPVVVRMGKRQAEAELANLKDLLETQARSGA